MTKFDPENSIWTEKYRPRKVSDMVGDFKDKIMKYLENPKSIPNFLFYSRSPGSGKTTLAKCIVNELGCDVLIMNSSDDRKIDTIREKVKEFSMTQSSKVDLKRCVFLDEVDGMLKDSQNALRNLIETTASNTFFILTCNSLNKVIEPLQSRCTPIPFAYPNKEDIYKYLEKICKKENMDYTEEGITYLVEKNYPNIRNCVLSLQDIKTQGKIVTKENVTPVYAIFDDMWKSLKERKWLDIKKAVMESTVEPRELNIYFWNKAIEEDNIKIIQLTCRNEKDIAWGADARIVFVTSLIEMVK